jgi:hypothetical protein
VPGIAASEQDRFKAAYRLRQFPEQCRKGRLGLA